MAADSGVLDHGALVLARYLEWARRGGEGPSDDEVYEVLGGEANPAVVRGVLRERTDLADCRLTTAPVEEEPGQVAAAAVTGSGARMRAAVVVRPDGNAWVMVTKALPDGFRIRAASDEDGRSLAELCRRCPIVVGEWRTTIDYGDDYLKATRVDADRLVLVAEHDDRIVGLHGCVFHDGVFGDEHQLLAYLRHTRIDPDMQGVGLFSSLNGALFERGFAAGAQPYSLVVVGNDKMLGRLPPELRRWPWFHRRFLLETRGLAQTSVMLESVDSGPAADLVNALHANAAICPPVTARSMQRRVNSTIYGPDGVLGTDEAMIGVSGRRFEITNDGPRGSERRTETVALDIGAISSEAFLGVLGAWCARLADMGIDDLAIDVSTASILHDPISELARSSRTYALQLALEPPPDAITFRVDPAFI